MKLALILFGLFIGISFTLGWVYFPPETAADGVVVGIVHMIILVTLYIAVKD